MKKAKGFTLIDVLVIAGIVAILPGLIWPSIWRARESKRRAQCLSNLKQIMLGIKTYTPDYDESYPTSATPVVEEIRRPGRLGPWRRSSPGETDVKTHYRDLGILYPYYVSSLDVFTCPSSGDKMPRDRTDDTYDAKPFRPSEAKQVSYAYGYNGEGAKNLPWTEAAPSETRVLADRHASKALQPDSNHNLDGRNVVFADGHVKWISGKEKLRTNPDHPDSKMRTQSWWSERPDRPLPKK